MKELVIKYLNSQYEFNVYSYYEYKLRDKLESRLVPIQQILKTLPIIFSISETEMPEIFDVWAEEQFTIYNNKYADLMYKYEEQYRTGK